MSAGRRTKLSAEVQQRIVVALRAGNHANVAARYAGVHASTFYRWLERGDPDRTAARDVVYRELREAVECAQAEAEVRNVTLITKAAERQWAAAAWLLQRRYPERWGPRAEPRRRRFGRSPGPDAGEAGQRSRRDLRRLSISELRKIRGRPDIGG